MNGRKMIQPKGAVRGFTLIETLIAFLVMAVGLAALFGFFSASQTNTAEAKAQAQATSLAESRLLELESFLTSSDPRLQVTSQDCFDDERSFSFDVEGQTTDFDVCWEIVDAGSNSARKTATVNVSWKDRNQEIQNVVLSSEIFFREPTKSSEQFMKLVKATDQAGDNTGEWLNPGEGRETVETMDRDTFEQHYPEVDLDALNYAENSVYIYRITITGSVEAPDGIGLTDVVVVEQATEVSALDPNSDRVYEPDCSSSSTSYTCSVYFYSYDYKWEGVIDYTASDSNSSQCPVFVAPTAEHQSIDSTTSSCSGEASTLSADFAPLQFGTTVNVQLEQGG